MRLLGDKIILERVKEEKIGHIFLPDDPNKRARKGIVKHVGTGKKAKNGKRTPHTVKPGDTVYYWRNHGQPVDIDPITENVVICEDQLLGVEC